MTSPIAPTSAEAQPPASKSAVQTPSDAAPPAELSSTIQRLRAARALLWATVGVMTVIWLFFGGGLQSITALTRTTPKPPSTADIGQVAPELKLPLAGGGEVDLAGYKGRPVIVSFWATWCEPCRAEMPAFERAQQQYADQGLVVLAVDFQERDEEIQAFLHEIGVTFPSAVDRTGETTRDWRANGLPTTFLIDRQGIIRDVRVGAFTDEMLRERLAGLLAE